MPSITRIFISGAALAATVSAHGQILKPSPRQPGQAMASACGQQIFNMQSSDSYGNIQGEMQVLQSDFNAAECNLWLCKGYQFADNTANVHAFTAEEVVPITIDIRAPHTGVANVSVVATASNTIIGSELISFDEYASNSVAIPANNTQFSITMPDVGSQCATAGDCVIQWYWNAASIDQTYEACIDFTMGGSGTGGASTIASSSQAPGSSDGVSSTIATVPAISSSAAAITSAVPSTSAPVVATPATSSLINSAAPAPTTLQTSVRPASSTTAIATSDASSSPSPTASPTVTTVPELPAGTKLTDLLTWLMAMIEKMSS